MTNESKPTPARRSPWHIYPPGWQTNHWLVPYQGDAALIHHGHSDPGDHSQCGPLLFCCAKSQQAFVESFPDSEEAKAEWGLTEAEHIHEWVQQGVQVLYFIFCDPVSPRGLFAGGLLGEQALQALFRETLLEEFTGTATRLR